MQSRVIEHHSLGHTAQTQSTRISTPRGAGARDGAGIDCKVAHLGRRLIWTLMDWISGVCGACTVILDVITETQQLWTMQVCAVLDGRMLA
jgi:hypothetical protein